MLKQQHQQRRQRIQLQGLNRKRTLKYLMIAFASRTGGVTILSCTRKYAHNRTFKSFFSAADWNYHVHRVLAAAALVYLVPQENWNLIFVCQLSKVDVVVFTFVARTLLIWHCFFHENKFVFWLLIDLLLGKPT